MRVAKGSISVTYTSTITQRGPRATSIRGVVADDQRYRVQVSINGKPAFDEIVVDDAVAVRYAVRVNGLDALALTKLDVLDGFETVSICTGYRIGGATFDYLPPHAFDQDRVEPIYEEMDGWSGTTAGARNLDPTWAARSGVGGKAIAVARSASRASSWS
mgnify:CR=1 FL=1